MVDVPPNIIALNLHIATTINPTTAVHEMFDTLITTILVLITRPLSNLSPTISSTQPVLTVAFRSTTRLTDAPVLR